MRLCKDCKHSAWSDNKYAIENWTCFKYARLDPVLGEYKIDTFTCSYCRTEAAFCKPQGIFWEGDACAE